MGAEQVIHLLAESTGEAVPDQIASLVISCATALVVAYNVRNTRKASRSIASVQSAVQEPSTPAGEGSTALQKIDGIAKQLADMDDRNASMSKRITANESRLTDHGARLTSVENDNRQIHRLLDDTRKTVEELVP